MHKYLYVSGGLEEADGRRGHDPRAGKGIEIGRGWVYSELCLLLFILYSFFPPILCDFFFARLWFVLEVALRGTSSKVKTVGFSSNQSKNSSKFEG